MDRFMGLIGVILILGIAFAFSNNRKAINYRLVFSGIALQIIIGVLIFRVEFVKNFFQQMGHGIQKIEVFAKEGANFVYGGIVVDNGVYPAAAVRIDTLLNKEGMQTLNYFIKGKTTAEDRPIVSPTLNAQGEYVVQNGYRSGGFIFGFSVMATIILVCVLVAIFYQIGIMQHVVSLIAKAMNVVMKVSGAEALSNVASAFVGQVEAQVMIRPYLSTMTNSELLASMSGSLACIAGGILVVYISFGAKAEYLLAASIMAAPAALVISKIVMPETEESQTMGSVKLDVKKPYRNIIDAISHGASDGMKISVNVIAMLIGFIGLIALVNFLLAKIGMLLGLHSALTLDIIFSKIFYPVAWCMGVPMQDVNTVATLMGQKLTINEFVAFDNMTHHGLKPLTEKGLMIASIAICGFANFSSVGMQIGGIGELAPERKADLAKLGLKALLCGTLASYLSATLAGLLM